MTDTKPSPSDKAIVREGVFDAVKIGTGETYLGAFAVYLGGTPLQIGALATLPPLVGAVAQSLGVVLVERIKSRRKVLTRLMAMQGFLWMPIALVPFVFTSNTVAITALLIAAILYQITIGVISPIWSSLVGDVVEPEVRGEFFGSRNRWIAITTFAALGVAGECIHQAKNWGVTAAGFSTVFFIAGASRLLSAYSFKKVLDPSFVILSDAKFSFWRFISRVRHSNFVKFVLFVSGMNFAAAVAGPYFAIYMLRDLQFSYLEYTVVVATAVLVQFVVMRSWGRLSDQFGNRRILTVCGWIVAFNPFLWLISSHFVWILFVQVYSGFFWAGFNLAAANFVFDAVTPPKRPRCVAYQAIINGVLVCTGSILGGLLIQYLPQAGTVALGLWTPKSPFLLLFLVSGILRLLVVFKIMPAFEEVREVEHIHGRDLLVRVSSLRPISGATFAFLAGKRSSEEETLDDQERLA
jgi:MFS family permease